METKIPCKKCLLADIAPGEEYEKIQRLLALMPEKEKAVPEELQRRLEICRRCASLSEATCTQCGCYVELRAAKKKERCPMRRW